MKTIALLIAGAVVGVALTFVTVQVSGGWYTYVTVPAAECHAMPPGGEVVPNQPNPCHFRYRRWRWP